jgi:hypothetical protein
VVAGSNPKLLDDGFRLDPRSSVFFILHIHSKMKDAKISTDNGKHKWRSSGKYLPKCSRTAGGHSLLSPPERIGRHGNDADPQAVAEFVGADGGAALVQDGDQIWGGTEILE